MVLYENVTHHDWFFWLTYFPPTLIWLSAFKNVRRKVYIKRVSKYLVAHKVKTRLGLIAALFKVKPMYEERFFPGFDLVF